MIRQPEQPYAPVLAADRRREAGLSDAAAAAPVARDVADAGEPDPSTTRRDRGRVDALATDQGDAPRPGRAGTQDREGVVEDQRVARGVPGDGREGSPQPPDVLRIVRTGEAGNRRAPRQRPFVRQTRVGPDAGNERRQSSRRHRHPDRLVRDRRPANGTEETPVRTHQRDVSLGVAAVDRQDRCVGHPIVPRPTYPSADGLPARARSTVGRG
jgi:hypothetical protein